MVSFKTTIKSIGVIIICFSAVFLETLFLSYQMELLKLDTTGFNELQKNIYNANLDMCNMMNIIDALVIGLFSFILLFFSIERYVDENKSNMGVLKALGYSNNKISLSLMKFALPVFIGCILGYICAVCFSKIFFDAMNNGKEFGVDISFHFNVVIFLVMILLLPIVTLAFSYLVGRLKLRAKPLDMINNYEKNKKSKRTKERDNFLKEVRMTMLKNHISLIIFVAFATLCFSANIQMAFTMKYQAHSSDIFFWMILGIGLMLGFAILLLAFRFVFKGNLKYMSMLKAYGYKDKECYYALYGGYHLVSALSFIIGTLYMFMIMKIAFASFADAYGLTYSFDWKAMFLSFGIFISVYVLINLYYYLRIGKLKLDSLNADLG